MSKTLRTYIREAILESENLQVASIREYGSMAGIIGGLASASKKTYDEFFGDDEQTSTGGAPAGAQVQEDIVALRDLSGEVATAVRTEISQGLSPATKNLLYDASMMKDNAVEIISDITKRIEEDGDAGTVMSVSDYGVFFKNVSELLAQDAADDVGYPYRTGLYVIGWTGEDETIRSTAVDAGKSLAQYYRDGVITIPMSIVKKATGGAAEVVNTVVPEARSYTRRMMHEKANRAMQRNKSSSKQIIQEVSFAWLAHIPGVSVVARAATVGAGRAISGGIRRVGIPSATVAEHMPSWASFSTLVKTTPTVVDDALKHTEVVPVLSDFTGTVRALVPGSSARAGWTQKDSEAFIKAMIQLDAEENILQNTLSYAFRDRAGGKSADIIEARLQKLQSSMSKETGETPDVVLGKLRRYIEGIKKNPSYVGSIDDVMRATFKQITQSKFKVGPANVGGFLGDFTNEYVSTLITLSWFYGLTNLIADKDRFLPLTSEETENIWQVYTIRDGSAKAIGNFQGWEEVYYATEEASAAISKFTVGRGGPSTLDSLKEILTDSIPGLRVVSIGEMSTLSAEFAGLAKAVGAVESDFDPISAAPGRPGAVLPRGQRARPAAVPTRDPKYNPAATDNE